MVNHRTTSRPVRELQYEAIFHVFGRVMSYQATYKKLPNYVRLDVLSNVVPLKTLNNNTPAENTTNPANTTSVFLKATKNCQVNDPTIIALANQLTQGVNSTWGKAEAIFNWVRNNLTYSFYYNTKYGAVNTLKNKSGNCVDHTHLLIVLTRAAGIESRYAHGNCQFKSGSVYGHVWAELLIDGKWVKADASSSSNNLGVINNWNTANVVMKGVYSELSF
ncbi:MAG: transglutaminase family protein [Euryarchaeota archaeon]|nr:transglutaminase family protein [Euryarchaeota archaeon]MBV1730588.1 transglutaminase family protein [Methanobacterium sp.]MBV1755670.1 transglutaminase family protein [Methanobacterium sp.]